MANNVDPRPARMDAAGGGKCKLLLLQNPGRGSRHCLDGIIAGLKRLHVSHCILEMQEIWATSKTDAAGLVRRLSQVLLQQKIGAALGYGFNGMACIPPDGGPVGNLRSFFEIRGIPHLMLWVDHPHWHADLTGLNPDLQGMFRSANSIHFLKSAAHTLELERMLGWPNCFPIHMGVEPEQFLITSELARPQIRPEFDLITICGEKGELPEWLREFVALDDPDPAVIRSVILEEIYSALEKLWRHEAPDGLVAELTALGRKWAGMKCREPFTAAMRFWPALLAEFPGACWYLTMAYPTYFKALRILWRLREWERRFYPAYLAKYFKVAVFGGDWSALGLGPGGWVDYTKQSEIYARGKVALNIADGHDEEGLTLKPFEIAAAGLPMLHYRATGLSECFEPGREVEVFERPAEARRKLKRLVEDDSYRISLASASHQRTLKEHTWDRRIEQMFTCSRLPIEAFRE